VVIQLSEQLIVDQIVERLAQKNPCVPAGTVSALVRDIHARYDGRPIRDFVPLFVERHATDELGQLPVSRVAAGAP
jgi:hypothetical protein